MPKMPRMGYEGEGSGAPHPAADRTIACGLRYAYSHIQLGLAMSALSPPA